MSNINMVTCHSKHLQENEIEVANLQMENLVAELQRHIRGHLEKRAVAQRISVDIAKYFGPASGAETVKNSELLRRGLLLLVAPRLRLLGLDEVNTPSADAVHSFAALLLSAEYMGRASRLVTLLFRELPQLLAEVDPTKLSGVRAIDRCAAFFYQITSPPDWELLARNTGSKAILPIVETLVAKLSSPLRKEEALLALAKLLCTGLKGAKPYLSNATADRIFAVVLGCMTGEGEATDFYTRMLAVNFLVAPALVATLSPKTLAEWRRTGWFERILRGFKAIQCHAMALSSRENLCLLANFIHLSFLEQRVLALENLLDWTNVMNFLFAQCQAYSSASNKRKNWHHPILGWTSERIDEGTQGTFGRIRLQLAHFWSQSMVQCLFGKVLCSFDAYEASGMQVKGRGMEDNIETIPLEIVQKLLKKLSHREHFERHPNNKGIPMVSITAVVCQLYQNALLTFSNSQIEILSGLCRDEGILTRLWDFVSRDAEGGLDNYLLLLRHDPTVSLPHFAPLHLFADIAYSLISILDEKEMYENETPFKIGQLRSIAKFATTFCFKAIWDGLIDLNEYRPNAMFQSIYLLCTTLYSRDCRRAFTGRSDSFWISNDLKVAQFIAEFEKQSRRAQLLMEKMPHVIPLKDRMVLFRKLIKVDKEGADSNMTVIKVDRTRVVEDGYQQLASLSSQHLKGTIRVKFMNQFHLDEAGIDQDGVFKEFLELTLTKVFDPELNLFKSTSNHLLYPSNTSSIHPNHLALFQFVGRMLAKAVYEGICIDVQLAPVLLATVLGKQLCPFDELATLDPVLYRNLTYVKHYRDTDDVADLELSFSYTEEFLGKTRVIELISGGQDVKVTNENRVMYIHKMAQMRVVTQTKEICENFVAGFRSIIHPKWLSLFNTHELQYLISGHASDIDIEDLRRHVQYYGGFHANHRLIKWLWSILQSEFNAEERHLFLKFVTSCSRPPLLGFAYLEPPFSIRCIETSDDNDQGDTLGSVVRGFLAIRRKQPNSRLPTASTCFNLLKLPNYAKRSILLEKLRYAIHAETGFELS